MHISYERHHKHSYYLIKNGDLRGFEPEEIEIIALVARYHRQATPKKSHEGFGDLPARSAADGPHARGDPAAGRKPRPQPRAGASRASSCTTAATTTSLQLRTTGDAELELWAAAPARRAARATCSASRSASKWPAEQDRHSC